MSRSASRQREEASDPEALAAELLGRMARKERDALRGFYQLYAGRIGKFLMKLLKQPELVDEAVNDALLAIWQSAADFDPAKGKLSTWIFGIAYHKGLNILERVHRHRAEQLLDFAPDDDGEDAFAQLATTEEGSTGFDPLRSVLGWELGEILNRTLEQLSAEHQAVLELTFSEGYNYQEIAEITGCPANTVKTRVFNARKKLFQLLERQGYSPDVLAQEGGL